MITLKGIIDEDFVNYRVPSMTLMFPYCSFKCGKEYCQNYELFNEPNITVDVDELCLRYINNHITEAIVCQGLEPFDSWKELHHFIYTLRVKFDCYDDVVIYTGYDEASLDHELLDLKKLGNIVVKFEGYEPNQKPHYDSVLGVNLASDNQYAERIC